MKPHLFCIVLLLGLVVGGLTACAPAEPVKLGYLGGLSGRASDLGEAGRNGVLLAVEQANAAGGINGRKIELLIRDDGQNEETARAAIGEFAQAGVAAVIGPMTSRVAMAVLEPSGQAGLTVVSPTVTASTFSGRDDHFFKVVSSTAEHARISAAYQHAAGLRRVAVILDAENAAFTNDWLEQYRQAFEALGGQMVAAEIFASGEDASYAQAVGRLKAVEADSLHFIANAADAVRLLLIARAQGLHQPASAATWAATERLLELGGQTVEDLIVTQYFDREDTSAAYLAFREAYRARFQDNPGFASVAAYDAARAVIVALRKQASGQALKQTLLSAGPYAGIQGEWNFDRYGDGERKAWAAVVRGGRFVRVD